MEGPLLDIAQTFGLPVALCVYLMWRDYKRDDDAKKREEVMISRIKEIEDFQRNELTVLVKEVAKILERATAVMERVNAALLSAGISSKHHADVE